MTVDMARSSDFPRVRKYSAHPLRRQREEYFPEVLWDINRLRKPIKKVLPVWRTIELNTFCLYTFAVVVFPGFLSWSRRGSGKTGDGKTKRKKTILFGQVSLETERYLKNRSHLHWAVH